jgi:PAS domain S-box-containing protein
MEDELRKSGIEVIGSVPWGTHFCQFYRTKQDLIDVLVPYFKTGLENNEFCMWITAEPLKTSSARAALRQAVPDLDRYIQKGQIKIIPHTRWYLLEGKFDDERVLNGWVIKLEQALAKGYSGLRLTGNTFWLERNGWQAFTGYEAKVNNIIGKYRMLAICTYCLDKCDGAAVVDVVKNHQFALIKEKGMWDIIESTIYKQAKDARLEAEEGMKNALEKSRQREHELDLLARSGRALLEYGEFKDAAQIIFNYCKQLLGATAGYVALLSEDGTQNELVFLDAGELNCTVDPSLPMPIRGLRAETSRTGKVVYDNDFAVSEWLALMPAGHARLDNVLFAPLIDEGKVIGLIGLANKPGGFTENDARLAMSFGEQAALAVKKSRIIEALQASEKRYRSFIEATGELGWTTSAEGEVVEDIPTFRRYTGQSFDEVKGWGWSKALHPDDLENTTQVWTKAIKEKTGYEVEYRLRRYDGAYNYFLARAVPAFDEDGNVREWVGTCIDITERKKTEQLKDEFIGMVSHELKTPLTVIMGGVHTLLSEGLTKEDRKLLLRDTASSTESLATIIDNLLELSRAQANRLMIRKELVDIFETVRKVTEFLSKRSAIHQLVIDIPAGLPVINADRVRVERILHNLVENAIKYSPDGGTITISAQQKDNCLVIGVRDEGVGISAEDQSRLFHPFERLGTAVGVAGVGLGLNVCRHLVEAHGGSIRVESERGKGAAFFFTLPL